MSLNQQIERWLASRKKNFQLSNRPFITLAFAQSWDGSITTRTGESITLSCGASNQLTHQLRSLHEGILVGIETVLSDNPQLTVREWTGNNPQPIILDSRLRMPQESKLNHHPDKKCWLLWYPFVLGTSAAKADIIAALNSGVSWSDSPSLS